jgi:hypothetical protein
MIDAGSDGGDLAGALERRERFEAAVCIELLESA